MGDVQTTGIDISQAVDKMLASIDSELGVEMESPTKPENPLQKSPYQKFTETRKQGSKAALWADKRLAAVEKLESLYPRHRSRLTPGNSRTTLYSLL